MISGFGYRLLFLSLFAVVATGCEEGDWLGPFERGLRGMVNGWDMWATEAVRPYEEEMPGDIEGAVSIDGLEKFERGRISVEKLSAEQRKNRGKLSYRRYCHHCHGPRGDGRIIVGESLEIPPTDLRQSSVQSKSNEELIEHLKSGGDLMLPLSATMSPVEMYLAIEHLRTLQGKPTRPYYSPKSAAPIQ